MHYILLGITMCVVGLMISIIGTSNKTAWIVCIQGKQQLRVDTKRMYFLCVLSAILLVCGLVMESWEPQKPGEWSILLAIVLTAYFFLVARIYGKKNV